MKYSKNQHGYIALMTVLIVGAVSIAICTTLLLTGTDAARSTLNEQYSVQARKLADACGEEALQIIHDTPSFTGTSTLTLSTGTCSYTVTSTGASTRTIDANSTVNGVVRKIQAYVTINVTNLNISSWQELG